MKKLNYLFVIVAFLGFFALPSCQNTTQKTTKEPVEEVKPVEEATVVDTTATEDTTAVKEEVKVEEEAEEATGGE